MLKLNGVKIIGNRLYHKTVEIPLGLEGIEIPYHCFNGKYENYEFFAEASGQDISSLYVCSVENNSQHTYIIPYYETTSDINLKDAENSECKLTITLAKTPQERKEAYCLIINHHYIPRPSYGLILIAKLQPKGKREKIVGCVILDTLTYANPKGREKLALAEGRLLEIKESAKNKEGAIVDDKLIWHKANRKSVVNILKVAWISRLVVDPEYKGNGIGKRLLNATSDVAFMHRIPYADYIEVITSHKKSDSDAG